MRARPGRQFSRRPWKLDNLIAIVDVNNMQADGPSTKVLNFEPLGPKWEAFGWHVQRVHGNDIDALVTAFDRARGACRAAARHHLQHPYGEGCAIPGDAGDALPSC